MDGSGDIATRRIPWDFGRITLDHYSDTPITIRNSLNTNLTISQIAGNDPILAPFSIKTDGCTGKTLAPSESCSFDVRFEPAQQGAFQDSFDIRSSDPEQTIAIVTVSGEGIGLNVSINQIECANASIKAYVTVTDRHDEPLLIPDSAFTVRETESGQVPFMIFNTAAAPVSVALAIDYSGSTRNAEVIDDMELAATYFVELLTLDIGTDEAEIMKFGAGIVPADPTFTDIREDLKYVINKDDAIGAGQTLLYDASWLAVDHTHSAARNSNKAVIVLSDGLDEGSTKNLSELIGHALENGVPIFTIGLGQVLESPLRQMAEETGGLYFHAPESTNLQEVYTKISSILINRYSITFETRAAVSSTALLEVNVDHEVGGEILTGADSRIFTVCP